MHHIVGPIGFNDNIATKDTGANEKPNGYGFEFLVSSFQNCDGI